ncbi:hypothetical protein LTR84_001650 [Exophiala bonariae]|uniref:Major facilitator superfamily (MFS) profile domain-containing protein n=1 Tax=Exophiala bonariae TaxID=1690606 RepID=A0AAV9NEY6_9EURO|nr:hypothetical protein LTR84_001650 [Exophiala bonariae]
MPLGILEQYGMEYIPGTVPLQDSGSAPIPDQHTSNPSLLKHDNSGKFVLVPQPSDDPNDPLNWPRWRKEMFIVSAIWGVTCVGAIGPLLAPAYVQLAETWNVSLQQFSSGTNGALIVCLAAATLVGNLLAVQFGKRPVYLTAAIGLVATSFWGSASTSWTSFVASRAFAGISMAPAESLIPASIADIWYVHERGTRTALFNLAFMAGVSIGPLIAGQLIQRYDWRICSYAMSAALVINLFLTFFFMPETAYQRVGTEAHRNLANQEKGADLEERIEDNTQTMHHDQGSPQPPTIARRPFRTELAFYSGYFHPISFWKTLLSPFKLFRSPIVLWASVVYMTAIVCIVILTIGASQIFSSQPYNFGVSAVGNTFLSAFIASIMGTVAASPLVDGVSRFMARKNGGLFEPEFRLPAVMCYLLFTATGFFSAGQSLGLGMPWQIPVILSFSFVNFGVVIAATVAITYTVDCHHEHAAEAVSVMVFLKNMFGFGTTYYLNDWITNSGVRNVFFTLGGITAAITLSAIPM